MYNSVLVTLLSVQYSSIYIYIIAFQGAIVEALLLQNKYLLTLLLISPTHYRVPRFIPLIAKGAVTSR